MNQQHRAIIALQWTLGIVILVEAGLFVLGPHAGHDFAQTHMPQVLRLILGWAEILAAILFLIPKTAERGAWMLLIVFALAILLHLLHGMPNVGGLLVYAAGAWVVAALRGHRAAV